MTEDVVASLDRYPLYEQQAWAQSLPPLAMQVYRQMVEAKKRGIQTVLADPPSSGRPTPIHVDRPPEPTIRCLDFAFSAHPVDDASRAAIRLHNLRGVISHAIFVSAETAEIELTAYIDPTEGGVTSVPEMSLRVNGNQGSLPKFVFRDGDEERPRGMKWTVHVPVERTQTKIEVTATKPGAMAETCLIIVSRQ